MLASYQRGLRHGLPIALGYLSVSFAFGIQATSLGLTPLQAVMISFFNVTSAGQLAGLQLMAAGAGLTEMALTQLTINLRYALMSLSLSQKLDSSMTLPHRFLLSFCNTDEVFVVASQQPGKVGRAYLYGLTNGPFIGWVLGTALGALAGGLLPKSVTDALGIARISATGTYPSAAGVFVAGVSVLLSAGLSPSTGSVFSTAGALRVGASYPLSWYQRLTAAAVALPKRPSGTTSYDRANSAFCNASTSGPWSPMPMSR